jgi:hypothetical protein
MADDFEALAAGEDVEPGEPPSVSADPREDQEAPEDAALEALGEDEEGAAQEPEPAPSYAQYLNEGETPETALLRLAQERDHHAKRADSHYHDFRDLREQLGQMKPQLAAAEKFYAAMLQRQEQEDRRRIESDLPDPELEPEKAILFRLEGLQQQLQWERGERERMFREQQLTAQQQAEMAELDRVDSGGFSEILAGLGQIEGAQPDSEFTAAFHAISQVDYQKLADRYPHATAQQITQGLNLVQAAAIRKAAREGISIREVYKHEYQKLRAAISAAGGIAPQGNGSGSPTAQEIAAQANRGGGLRRRTGGGSVELPPSLGDFAALPEDQQAKLIMEGKLNEDDLWGTLAVPLGPTI